MHRNPRHVIPHHAPGCVEHNGCVLACPVLAFVQRHWNMYDDVMKWAYEAQTKRISIVDRLEANYGK